MQTNDRSTQVFKQEQSTPIRSKKGSYERWRDGFLPGLFLGIFFLFLNIVMITLEVSRILTGSLNRGTTYKLYPGNIYYPAFYSTANSYNVEREHHYLWPWSHPSLFFAIPVFLASLFGICSGRRGTYSMIYLFFTFSLISFLLTPFLIVYFSINVYRHNSGNTLWQSDSNVNRDRTLSIFMLALSLLLFLVSLLATVLSAIGFSCCFPKGGGYLSPIKRYGYYDPPTVDQGQKNGYPDANQVALKTTF